MEVAKEFFANLNYMHGDISDDDAKIILETADADKDGRIGLDDFRMMVRSGRPDTRKKGRRWEVNTQPAVSYLRRITGCAWAACRVAR